MKVKRPLLLAAISGSAAYLIWRTREQGRLATTFLENAVPSDLAEAATSNLIPFWSLTTYTDVIGDYAPDSPEEWSEYASAAAGNGLVLLG